MVKNAIMKTKFSQTNDKRCYFLNGITSLPVGHPFLKDLTDYKERKDKKIEKYFLDQKDVLKQTERNALSLNNRLDIYKQTLAKIVEY